MNDLEAIRRRAQAATKGPWFDDAAVSGCGRVVMSEATGYRLTVLPESDLVTNATADAAFIASAREDIPALCAEVERLRALCGEAAKWIDGIAMMNPQGERERGAFVQRLCAAAEGRAK